MSPFSNSNTSAPRIAFFGTSEFAVYVLERMKELGTVPYLVITTPDRPQGRKLVVTPCPAKKWAMENNINVISPEKIRDETFERTLRSYGQWDLFIVASYGRIIPQHILDIPRRHTINVHPSLLPLFRGPSPIESVILADTHVEHSSVTKKTGVTIIELDADMDHGPIIAQAEYTVSQWPSRLVLERDLARCGADILVKALPAWLDGSLKATEQDHTAATYTKKITKADGEIALFEDDNENDHIAITPALRRDAITGAQGYENFKKIKAYDGWPHAYAFYSHKKSSNGGDEKIRIIVNDAEWNADTNSLTITRVTPEGKKEMSYEDFVRGFAI